jgi:hypothetical protein
MIFGFNEKLTFNISKKMLRTISGQISLVGEEAEISSLLNQKCTSRTLPGVKRNHKVQKLYCEGTIEGALNLRRLLRKTRIRLSNSQIKQILMYYYLADSKGFINCVRKKHLSETIGCTYKTIDNNNVILDDLGIITLARTDERGLFSVKINNYEDQYKKGHNNDENKDINNDDSDNGQGYVVFSTGLLKQILKVDNVNALRVAIRAILKNDYNQIINRKTKFTIDELKELLPSNMHSLPALDKAISSLSNRGIIGVQHKREFVFYIGKDLDGKNLKRKKTMEWKKYYQDFLDENNIILEEDNKLLEDLTSMSAQYGFETVKTIFSQESGRIDKKTSCGGYLRNRIKEYIYVNSVSFNLV